MYWKIAVGLLIPFAGTALGAAMVFLLRREIHPRLQKLLLGFASGVMVAAPIRPLILPSADPPDRPAAPVPPPAAGRGPCRWRTC